MYKASAYLAYMQFLKVACDAYGKDFFRSHYSSLSSLARTQIEKTEFLKALQAGDQSVGESNDLGEVKTAVLFQVLSCLNGEWISVFCSDDKDACAGMVQFDGVSCLRVLSLFWYLKTMQGLTKSMVNDFYQAYIATLSSSQSTFTVVEAGLVGRHIKVPFDRFFEDLYNDKFQLQKTGLLKYI